MVLTDEQRKRMDENRNKALETRQRKQRERIEATMATGAASSDVLNQAHKEFVAEQPSELESRNKKMKTNDGGLKSVLAEGNELCHEELGAIGLESVKHINKKETEVDDDESLEDFERNASPYISQTEAQRTYCVPLGTLAVCSYIEKENPHKRGWSKMKLYLRSEVRSKARKRFGGKEGLIRERERRRQKRFQRDFAEMNNVFR